MSWPTTAIGAVLVGWAAIAGLMLVLWLVQVARKDAGIVDVGWAASLGLLACWYGAWAASRGYEPRVWLVVVLAAAWSLRLATYLLFNRVIGKHEDGRYQTLRRNWAANVQTFFFVFFQAQALLAVILSIPYLTAMLSPARRLTPWDFAGAAIWLIAVGGEGLADRQVAKFRANPVHRGRTCRDGLWRYSRHPNYFFEWLHWFAYVCIAIGGAYWYLALMSPPLILFFILRVSGIPPTEAQALASRGDDYRNYQRTTSAFVPWFPRRAKT